MNIKVAPEIAALVPYRPGKSLAEAKRQYGLSHFIKLASNECPLDLPADLVSYLSEALPQMNRYPDPVFFDLKQELHSKYKIPVSKMSFGNGSNEIIDLLIRGFCLPGDEILTSRGAFIAYKICAQAARVRPVELPLLPNYEIDLGSFEAYLEAHPGVGPKLIFIPNPNNPTGAYLSRKKLLSFLDKYGQREDFLIVIDQAYDEFVTHGDPVPELWSADYKNVCVLKTWSKVQGLAGLRLGMIIADEFVIDILDRIRNPFNVNTLAQKAALWTIQNPHWTDKIKDQVIRGREQFQNFLDSKKMTYVPSQGNFVFFDTTQDSSVFCDEALKKGLILRPLKNYGFNTEVRMSVGTDEENEFALGVLAELFE